MWVNHDHFCLYSCIALLLAASKCLSGEIIFFRSLRTSCCPLEYMCTAMTHPWPVSADLGSGTIKLQCRSLGSGWSPDSGTLQGGRGPEPGHHPEPEHLHCNCIGLQPAPNSVDMGQRRVFGCSVDIPFVPINFRSLAGESPSPQYLSNVFIHSASL